MAIPKQPLFHPTDRNPKSKCICCDMSVKATSHLSTLSQDFSFWTSLFETGLCDIFPKRETAGWVYFFGRDAVRGVILWPETGVSVFWWKVSHQSPSLSLLGSFYSTSSQPAHVKSSFSSAATDLACLQEHWTLRTERMSQNVMTYTGYCIWTVLMSYIWICEWALIKKNVL